MSDKKKNIPSDEQDKGKKIVNEVPDNEVEVADTLTEEDPTVAADVVGDEEEGSEIESLKNLLQQREDALEKEKKEYLFLMAEFDNFKKRTLREKTEILKNGGESVLKGLLPVIDDFERGLEAIKDSSDVESVKEGMTLIYNKFMKYLEQNGVKPIPTDGADFDVDKHEAIAMVPVDDEARKGKVIDTVQKGYTLNDKVIRHAKVAVGQ